MSELATWTRERWATAQINGRCDELCRDIRSVMTDTTLSLRQKAALCQIAIVAAADDLEEFEWFRGSGA